MMLLIMPIFLLYNFYFFLFTPNVQVSFLQISNPTFIFIQFELFILFFLFFFCSNNLLNYDEDIK